MADIVGTPKNDLNKIRGEEMERDNKEVHAHHRVDSAAFLLRVKNGVGSWYERAKGATNTASVDMKTYYLILWTMALACGLQSRNQQLKPR